MENWFIYYQMSIYFNDFQAINNHIVKCNSDHRSHETGERVKYNQIKSTRHNSHEGQMLTNMLELFL